MEALPSVCVIGAWRERADRVRGAQRLLRRHLVERSRDRELARARWL